jgi:hypothetical protein
LLLAVLLASACRGSSPLSDLQRARALTADLRLQLDKAEKASSRAVMADTDEASVAFVKEAQEATAAASKDLGQLGPLLKELRYSRESEALAAFQGHWSKFQKLEQDILGLAAENTNLKAQRLSFGPARDAADAFRDAVLAVVAATPGSEHCSAAELGQTAIAAMREIQVLQAPHIAEADDAAMTRMEHEMAALEQKARDALSALSKLGGGSTGPGAEQASASLDRFKKVSSEIVGLSRRNTNVRSLALSLRQQPTLAAACDESLRTLQQTLDGEGTLPSR